MDTRTNDWQPVYDVFFFVYIWLAASLYALVAMQLCSELRIGIIKVEQVLNKLDTNISDVAIV